MKKHYFLGLAANLSAFQVFYHTLIIGTRGDCRRLREFLGQKYQGKAILTKNGRSALAIALKAYFRPGDGVMVNGFTCFAVYEAVKAAGLTPVWVDIERKDLNFSVRTLENALKRAPSKTPIRGIIIQNSLGNPVNMAEIEKFAEKHRLMLIEDLAHSAGVKYPDGREAGTVGAAAALSFGKEKAIDATSGGAVVLRAEIKDAPERKAKVKAEQKKPGTESEQRSAQVRVPSRPAKLSDTMRARFYPLIGVICRGLSYLHLNSAFMYLMLKIHWVEKSADNRLDLGRKIAKFEAKCALKQLLNIPKEGAEPLRRFYLVENRPEVLEKLRQKGYFFDGFWYEKPVSPERYYEEVEFPEADCPVATEVAQKIVNLPSYYSEKELAAALRIIEKYVAKGARPEIGNRGAEKSEALSTEHQRRAHD